MSSRTFSSGNVDVEFYFLESHRAFAFVSGLCYLIRHVQHICLFFWMSSTSCSFLPYVDPWSGSQPCNMLSLWLMKRGQKCAVRPLCGFMGESYFHSPSLKAQNERAWRYSRSVWSLLYSEVKGDWTVKKKRHNEEQSLNGDRLALLCDLRELI